MKNNTSYHQVSLSHSVSIKLKKKNSNNNETPLKEGEESKFVKACTDILKSGIDITSSGLKGDKASKVIVGVFLSSFSICSFIYYHTQKS